MDDLGEEYWELIDDLMNFGDELGVPEFFWSTFLDLHYVYDIGLVADYFFVPGEDRLIRVTSDTNLADVSNTVRSGANFACQWSVPFSKEWYVCQASGFLRKCYSGTVENRMRASFHFGKAVAEAQWKERTESQLQTASTVISTRKAAGAGGGDASRKRRLANLEVLMGEIEKLASVVGIMSEERIIAQALEEARKRAPSLPKSRKSLDGYGSTLRSEEPFKSRYETVFQKNA